MNIFKTSRLNKYRKVFVFVQRCTFVSGLRKFRVEEKLLKMGKETKMGIRGHVRNQITLQFTLALRLCRSLRLRSLVRSSVRATKYYGYGNLCNNYGVIICIGKTSFLLRLKLQLSIQNIF